MPAIYHTHCPVCKSDRLQHVFFVKDHTVSGKEFEIVQCEFCSLRFTQNVPDAEEIGAYYKSEDYISHTNTKKGLISKLYQTVRVRTMKQKARIVETHTQLRNGKLLDVGCGTGTFLQTMQQRGWRATGLEPDADARDLAKELYNLHTEPSHHIFSLPHHHFNAITLWHVLEHVHQLQEYMAQLKNLVTEKGKIFIAVPNYTSRDAKFYKKHWAGYDVPRHLYHFTPRAMHVLASHHGLQIAARLPMWFDSFYVDILSSKYRTGKTNYLTAGLHGLASNINAIGNVNECCSIIYVLKK